MLYPRYKALEPEELAIILAWDASIEEVLDGFEGLEAFCPFELDPVMFKGWELDVNCDI